LDNFIYACVQLLHNLGAVIVVAAPVVALILSNKEETKHLPFSIFYIALAGWCLQIGSGIGFGITSYQLQGHIPQLEDVAKYALYIKVICATISSLLLLSVLLKKNDHPISIQKLTKILLVLGVTALCSAAFLRWYG